MATAAPRSSTPGPKSRPDHECGVLGVGRRRIDRVGTSETVVGRGLSGTTPGDGETGWRPFSKKPSMDATVSFPVVASPVRHATRPVHLEKTSTGAHRGAFRTSTRQKNWRPASWERPAQRTTNKHAHVHASRLTGGLWSTGPASGQDPAHFDPPDGAPPQMCLRPERPRSVESGFLVGPQTPRAHLGTVRSHAHLIPFPAPSRFPCLQR